MRAVAALALVLAACSPPDECRGIPQPPEAFDHPPAVAVRIGEAASVDLMCRSIGMQVEVAACSKGAVIVLPEIDGRTVTRTRWACYLRHEWGHINGASADHKGWINP